MTQSGSNPPGTTPDEQRVLDELERLQRAIRETRQNSERVQADFDTQLRAFEPPARPADPVVSASAPAAVVKPVAADAPRRAVARPVDATDRPAITPSEPAAPVAPKLQPHVAARTRRGTPGLAVIGTLVVMILAGGWFVSRMANGSPQNTPPATAPATVVTPPPQAPVSRPSPPVDPHPLRIDLTTLRRVWMRVTVDGRIAIEREVAAGEQLPFGADRTIVVRAGDAGAVTVKLGGVDQGPVGGDGQVVTRAYEAPAR